MKSEKRIEQEILLALSKQGSRLWKNSVGMGYTKDGQPFRYGLGNGSSDIIGITPTVITQDMVGKTVGVFTAIEVKKARTGYGASDKQQAFIEMVRSLGGFAGIGYDVESAMNVYTNRNLKKVI